MTYSDEALAAAVAGAKMFLPSRYFPGKAADVIDEAGSCAKLRRAARPDEVVEAQRRVRLNQQRAENAIVNHEYEKARFYSNEERKERENLRAIRQKLNIDESTAVPVTVDDIEAVIARWTGTSLDVIRNARSGHAGQESTSG